MKSKDIFDGITEVRDDLVEGAKTAPAEKKRSRKFRWIWSGAVAAVLVLAILGAVVLRPEMSVPVAAGTIAQAQYPKMSAYPGESEKGYDAWWNDVLRQRRELGDLTDLQNFYRNSAQVFLADTGGENKVYSPLNVYMALAMLAQLTDGESRSQILNAVGSESADSLRQRANDIWNDNYRDDGALTSILASSLWLDEDISYNQKTMDLLAQDLYASSFEGQMGSEEYNQRLQSWLKQQTGGLLDDQAETIKMYSDTVLALATTVYFNGRWKTEFNKNTTSLQVFHGPDGDLETEFLHQSMNQAYYWGEHFSAVKQTFTGGAEMWFLLPDEGVAPEELLSSGEAVDFLFSLQDWEQVRNLIVNKSIPKFDIASQFDLQEGLEKMGVTDVFDFARSDFSPMSDEVDAPIAITEANHAARVTIDEEGCTAAAFTVMAEAGAGEPPEEEADFVLDRPFLFCITGVGGLPLFLGVVNTPA